MPHRRPRGVAACGIADERPARCTSASNAVLVECRRWWPPTYTDILRHSLELLRLSAGEQAKAEGILRELERELKLLLQSRTLSEASKREIAR
jgi:hypothetical protein